MRIESHVHYGDRHRPLGHRKVQRLMMIVFDFTSMIMSLYMSSLDRYC